MVYLDTSALAKRYLNEPQSDALDAFLARQAEVAAVALVAVEFRCLVARRGRAGDLDGAAQARVLDAFDADWAAGLFRILPLSDSLCDEARRLIGALAAHPLRSLDALHLAAARQASASGMATADRVLAEAASAVGIAPVFFGSPG